jgi:hypothetical protein
MSDVKLLHGDCLRLMADIPAGSVDCIVADPPYPCIDRPYGRMTEEEWHLMMRGVVEHSRRILKPSGSAVFILQPNSERVGRMRPWLWEFMAWTAREWNMVQDAWWWRFDTMPTAGAPEDGMLRQSLKACVWLGEPDCYRDQGAVLWEESDYNKAARLAGRCDKGSTPSKWRPNTTPRAIDQARVRASAGVRGGVTPFNVLPFSTGRQRDGHPAATPEPLCAWWIRYICPPGGVVCDPFMGSGTTGRAAVLLGRSFLGMERDAGYFAMARECIAEAGRPISRLDPRPAYVPSPGQLALFPEDA